MYDFALVVHSSREEVRAERLTPTMRIWMSCAGKPGEDQPEVDWKSHLKQLSTFLTKRPPVVQHNIKRLRYFLWHFCSNDNKAAGFQASLFTETS